MERMTLSGFLVQRYVEKFLKFYLKKYPTVFHICYDPIGTHKTERALLGLLLGFIVALIFYIAVIVDLQFDHYASLIIGGTIVVLMSLGCALSIQIRCITVLTFPSFFGRAGRGFLKALVLSYAIAGPIFNLTYNAKEVVRTFVCSTELTYNLTKTRLDLMFKPFQKAVIEMKSDSNEVKDTLASVDDLISPVVEEIEGEEEMTRLKEESDHVDELQGDTKSSEVVEQKITKQRMNAKTEGDKYEANYREKIHARCEEQLNRGSEKCRDMFAGSYDKCYNTVSFVAAWILCWPMKLTFVCNVVQAMGGQSICDPEGKVDTGIGEGYVALKASQRKISQSLKDVKMQYKVKEAPAVLDTHNANDIAKAVMHDFETRRKIFHSVTTLVKRCLAFIFLRIILNAQKYHDRYLADIEFDNVYVTAYFRKIDARRKIRSTATVLPLKKIEKEKFVDPYGIVQGKTERRSLIGHSIKLTLEILTITTFILLDRLFYETLDLIRRHAHMEYTQAGHHDVALEIRGTGVVASLIRSVVRGFNVKRRIKTVVSNEACLPRPTKLSSYVLLKIYGTYTIIFILVFATAYTQRLRRVVCSFFYRRREKRRVLYLYNETLRRRRSFFRFMKAKVVQLARARQLELDADPWVALSIRWPLFFGWLKFFEFARRKCLICGEIEPRKNSGYIKCPTANCPAVHCPECWIDVGKMCLACSPSLADSDAEDYDTETGEPF